MVPNVDLVSVFKIIVILALAIAAVTGAFAVVGAVSDVGTTAAGQLKAPGETVDSRETSMSPWVVMRAGIEAVTGDVGGSWDLLGTIGAVVSGLVFVIIAVYGFRIAARVFGG